MSQVLQVCHAETNTWTGSGVGRFNEDYAHISLEDCCAVVVDGATGLTKANVVAGESDASWYARKLACALPAALADPSCTTKDALLQAGSQVAEAYRRIPGTTRLARIDEPNASLAILRWGGNQVEVSLLGDCTAVVLHSNGSASVLHDNTLTKLDNENYERMYAFALERGTTMAQARKALNPCFIENRLKMNEPDGYWAADISCRGMAHVQSFFFPKEQVEALFACSDGFAAAVEMGVVEGADELARGVSQGKGALLGQALRKEEQLDADCWRVHRSKTSDDATYVLVKFG